MGESKEVNTYFKQPLDSCIIFDTSQLNLEAEVYEFLSLHHRF